MVAAANDRRWEDSEGVRTTYSCLLLSHYREFKAEANIGFIVGDQAQIAVHPAQRIAGDAQTETAALDSTFALMTPLKKGSKIIACSLAGIGVPLLATSITRHSPSLRVRSQMVPDSAP